MLLLPRPGGCRPCQGCDRRSYEGQFDKVYNKAIEYLLVAKNLDVNHESKRLWAYPLYGCYYFVKGEKAPETEAAAADAGISGE